MSVNLLVTGAITHDINYFAKATPCKAATEICDQ